jgi:hypothetical protein
MAVAEVASGRVALVQRGATVKAKRGYNAICHMLLYYT